MCNISEAQDSKEHLVETLTLRWGIRTGFFLMIWDATLIEREKNPWYPTLQTILESPV